MSFFNVDNVVKASGSSTGTINTTFSAPDLAFDYLAAGEHLQHHLYGAARRPRRRRHARRTSW